MRAVAWSVGARPWSATVYAICATTPAGYEIVVEEQAGEPEAAAIVTCPAGTRVLGAGVRSLSVGPDAMLQAIAPSSDLTSARVAVSEGESGAAEPWTLEATAMCATPPAGLQLVSRTTAATLDEDVQRVAATCPAGKHVIGSGAEVLPTSGEVVIDDLRPSPGLTSVQVTAVEDRTGYPGPWALRAYAVCVNR